MFIPKSIDGATQGWEYYGAAAGTYEMDHSSFSFTIVTR